MAANTIGLSYAELRRWIGRQLGKSRDPSSPAWTTDTSTDVADALEAGLRQFYWNPLGHLWSFLEPTMAQLELHGEYTTGTISSSSTTVTLSGGTWPTWAAQGELWADSEWYTVASRSSNTVIVLDSAPTAAFSADTYSLKHREYDLPDDFGGLVESFTTRPDVWSCGQLTTVNEPTIRAMQDYPGTAGEPAYACIVSRVPTSSQESKQSAIFAPLSDSTRKLWYRYAVVPPMLDGSTYVYAHGGAQYHETLLLSCLDKALQMLYDSFEKHAPFLESLEASVKIDRKLNRPQTLGFGVYSLGYSGVDDLDYRDIRRRSTIGTIIL